MKSPTLPFFRKESAPILQNDRSWEGPITSVNSGLLCEQGTWCLWYASGAIGKDQRGPMRVLYAESGDGRNWHKPILADGAVSDTNIILPREAAQDRVYLPSAHREGERIVLFCWCDTGELSGLFRFVASDGLHFKAEPERPLISSLWASPKSRAFAGEERVSNDAFSVLQNEDGSYSYFAAYLQQNNDARTIYADDNLSRYRRVICRADSANGVDWTPTRVIIEPDGERDSLETQFYGMHVFRYREWYLSLLFVYFLEQQIIRPEWAWSRDGWSWQRSFAPCIAMGEQGAFDSRMILFGDTQIGKDELVWIYSGANWRHNDYARPDVSTRAGYAALPLGELDAWLGALS